MYKKTITKKVLIKDWKVKVANFQDDTILTAILSAPANMSIEDLGEQIALVNKNMKLVLAYEHGEPYEMEYSMPLLSFLGFDYILNKEEET